MEPNDVLRFWFEETEPKHWWAKDPEFDTVIHDRFNRVHSQAVQCELFAWRNSAEGRLAEIIIIDQFSRNMFRDQPRAFMFDSLALALAQEAVLVGSDKKLIAKQKPFLYMPYMHSESPVMHEIAVELFNQPGLEHNLEFEFKHKQIIERFGRYPHRNKILGRESTNEELLFLEQSGSSF